MCMPDSKADKPRAAFLKICLVVPLSTGYIARTGLRPDCTLYPRDVYLYRST